MKWFCVASQVFSEVEWTRVFPQGLKPTFVLWRVQPGTYFTVCGTTKVAPCYKTRLCRDSFELRYIASGLSMPSQLSVTINSRSATAAVASRNTFLAGSSSVRIWWR